MKKKGFWKGWAVVTKDRSEVRYVSGDRKSRPCLPGSAADLRRIKVVIREVRT